MIVYLILLSFNLSGLSIFDVKYKFDVIIKYILKCQCLVLFVVLNVANSSERTKAVTESR